MGVSLSDSWTRAFFLVVFSDAICRYSLFAFARLFGRHDAGYRRANRHSSTGAHRRGNAAQIEESRIERIESQFDGRELPQEIEAAAQAETPSGAAPASQTVRETVSEPVYPTEIQPSAVVAEPTAVSPQSVGSIRETTVTESADGIRETAITVSGSL